MNIQNRILYQLLWVFKYPYLLHYTHNQLRKNLILLIFLSADRLNWNFILYLKQWLYTNDGWVCVFKVEFFAIPTRRYHNNLTCSCSVYNLYRYKFARLCNHHVCVLVILYNRFVCFFKRILNIDVYSLDFTIFTMCKMCFNNI